MKTAMQELIDKSIEDKIKLILSARFIDIKIRKDNVEYKFEGDFLKDIIYKSEYYNERYSKQEIEKL